MVQSSIIAALLLSTLLYSNTLQAKNGEFFAKGTPTGLERLPASELKERIAELPAAAQGRALRWLQDIEFPAADVPHMAVDRAGGIYYIDPAPAELIAEATPSETTLSLARTFELHSNPTSTNVIYLDFDGAIIEGTAWNSTHARLDALAFDRDGDPTTFSDEELAAIHEIWHRVAEDFAAFDVDVTTEPPVRIGGNVGHLLITQNQDANGLNMPASGAGGVAYVNVFGRADYDDYLPAFVYANNLGNGTTSIAEAASHEVGHNLGLGHDGSDTTSYFRGLGDTSDPSSWAPIMGVGYYRNVTQWSRGEYPNASNTQDDVGIILNKLGQVADDHADDRFLATPLFVDSSGQIGHSNPENDPDNLQTENKGIIGSDIDQDFFSLDSGGGELTITATPSWDAFYRNDRRGANLDIRLTIFDESGTPLSTAESTEGTDATLSLTAAAGTYFVSVSGDGNSRIPYSDYGSQGMYFITGQITPSEPNEAPVAAADSVTTAEDQPVTIDVLVNDFDPDGDPLAVVSVAQPANGAVEAVQSGLRYLPNANWNGAETFNYTIGDGKGGIATALVSVTVTALNDAPLATADDAQTLSGASILIEVLNNDQDPDGDTLAVIALTSPSNGVAIIQGNAVGYTPNPGFSGIDEFSYTVSDGTERTDARVTVTVEPAPPEPPSMPDSLLAVDNADGSATLTWTESASAIRYEIERQARHKKRDAWQGAALVGATGETTFTDAPGNGTYRYRVRAADEAVSSEWTPWSVVDITGGSRKGGKGKPNR